MIISIVVFILILTVTITVHEWGHFKTAQTFGVYCKEFAIGMGKKIFSRQKGETEYTIRLLPMGGFVQMIGEDGEITNEVHAGDTVWIKQNAEGLITTIYAHANDAPDTKAVEVIAFHNEVEPIRLEVSMDATTTTLECLPLVTYYDKEQYEQWVVAKPRQFTNIKPWKKIVVLAAGATVNFITALLFIFVSTWISGVTVDPIISQDLYAKELGTSALIAGDTITHINDTAMELTEITSYVQENPGKEVTLTVERDGKSVEIKRTIQEIASEEVTSEGVVPYTYGALGIQYARNYTNIAAIIAATFTTFFGIFQQVFYTFVSLFSGKVSPTQLTGFVGIAQQTGAIIAMPTTSINILPKLLEIFGRLLFFAGFLGINIGALNLLPIPALDGGRIVFAIYEMIFKKKASPKLEMAVNAAGFLLLIGLFIMVTFLDIGRLFR